MALSSSLRPLSRTPILTNAHGRAGDHTFPAVGILALSPLSGLGIGLVTLSTLLGLAAGGSTLILALVVLGARAARRRRDLSASVSDIAFSLSPYAPPVGAVILRVARTLSTQGGMDAPDGAAARR